MFRSVARRPLAFVIAMLGLVVVTLIAVLAGYSATARASQDPYVELVQPSRVRVGEEVTVELVANNVVNLAGFQSTVRYDVAGLRVAEVVLDDDLKRSGRDMLSLGPVGGTDSVTLGAATCPAADCVAPQPWQVAKIEQGVDGRVTLATISFRAEAPGRYEVKLDGVQLVDPDGNVLPMTTVNTVVQVVQ